MAGGIPAILPPNKIQELSVTDSLVTLSSICLPDFLFYLRFILMFNHVACYLLGCRVTKSRFDSIEPAIIVAVYTTEISQEGVTMVDFEWYRSFICIFKHNSVSLAAKARIMTQPALSQHLASLEAEVGELLFTRTTRKLIPTERGKQLYSLLAPYIDMLEEKTQELRINPSSTTKTIKIGTTQELFTEKILAHLSKMNLNTITYFRDADELLELLREDRVDIILTNKKSTTPGIEYLPLKEEEFVIVAPFKTVVPDFTHLKDMEQWLLQQRWISYDLELPLIRKYWKEFFKASPQIIPVHVIPNLHLILSAIVEGEGLSVLPTYMLNDNKVTEPKWRIVSEQMIVRNELLVGFKYKHKHQSFINEFLNYLND
jgi:DNA-binding transcriptional LysR family regulator